MFRAIISLAIEPRVLYAHEIILNASLNKTLQFVDTFPGRRALYLLLRLC